MIGLLGQPEGMAAKYDLTVEAAGPPLPSREAHVGFSKIFFFFWVISNPFGDVLQLLFSVGGE